ANEFFNGDTQRARQYALSALGEDLLKMGWNGKRAGGTLAANSPVIEATQDPLNYIDHYKPHVPAEVPVSVELTAAHWLWHTFAYRWWMGHQDLPYPRFLWNKAGPVMNEKALDDLFGTLEMNYFRSPEVEVGQVVFRPRAVVVNNHVLGFKVWITPDPGVVEAGHDPIVLGRDSASQVSAKLQFLQEAFLDSAASLGIRPRDYV